MGSYKNLHVFNQIILLESQKFDAREIYVFYSIADECLHGVCEKSYFRHLWQKSTRELHGSRKPRVSLSLKTEWDIIKSYQWCLVCNANLKDADEDAINDFHDNKLWRNAQSNIRIPVHCQ